MPLLSTEQSIITVFISKYLTIKISIRVPTKVKKHQLILFFNFLPKQDRLPNETDNLITLGIAIKTLYIIQRFF